MAHLNFDSVKKASGDPKKGRGVVIGDLGFNVPAGDFYGLLGSSSAGKKTVLRQISGLGDPAVVTERSEGGAATDSVEA